MIKGHRIEKKIEVNDFISLVKDFKENDIITTKHTFFRLREDDRKIFKDKIIKEIILSQSPVLAGIQHNRLYAVFYKYEKNILKILLDIQANKINLVTFYIIDNQQLPRI